MSSTTHTETSAAAACLEERIERADHAAFRISMFGYGTNPQWQGEQIRLALRCNHADTTTALATDEQQQAA